MLGRIISLITLCAIPGLGFAEESPDVKTTYSIQSYSAEVKTEIKKSAGEFNERLTHFMFDDIAEKLKQLPLVTSIQYDGEEKGELTKNTYYDYNEQKRNFSVIVQLSFNNPVSMRFKVEEVYRICKPKEGSSTSSSSSYSTGSSYSSYSDARHSSGSSSSSCSLMSSTKITGPFSIQGAFPTAVKPAEWMKNSQGLTITLSPNTDGSLVTLSSTFRPETGFETGLEQLLRFLNRKGGFLNRDADSSFGTFDRINILKSAARIMRLNNERLVSL
jgi:hypothetical protein